MDRLVSAEINLLDTQEVSLRPQSFSEFPGQTKIKEKLSVYVQAARLREEALDHTLLCGPPGLGKTTMAHILAHELGVELRMTSGPALDKKGDLAAILTSLPARSLLFIDEIHRLNRVVEEYLYSAMEDFALDIVTGEGLGARSMRFKLAPFTLVGATTRAGMLHAPFRDRFGIVERLDFYSPEELKVVILRSAKILSIGIDEQAAQILSCRCRGTPRIANRLLKRMRDFAMIQNSPIITQEIAHFALLQLNVDNLGLDEMDRRMLFYIAEKFSGGPVGIETLAAALGEDRDTIEDVYEPFLIQQGFLMKTPRGRMLTELGKKHIEQ